MAIAVSTLLSKIKFDRQQTELTSANIARAGVEGYTRKDAYAVKILSQNAITGVVQSQISRVIDTVLQTEVRNKNSDLGKTSVLNDYYANIQQLLGNKGDESSFAHNLNDFAITIGQIASITDGDKKREAIQKAQVLCDQLNSVTNKITDLRYQVDQDLSKSITTMNSLMGNVQTDNRQIVALQISKLDTTNLEDDRDLAIHNMTELTGLKLYTSANNNISVALSSGDVITTLTDTYQLNYTAASYIQPGDVLSPITTSLGADITSTFSDGRISGLIDLRDTILPNFQAEMDELTRVLRDTANALHNEGAALGGNSTLTGLTNAPGVVGPLTGTTAISGQGTLRIGVTDINGTLLDYKDVPLTNGMTVSSLITSISTAAYVNGNASGNFTVSQLATGELQITSTAGNYVALGSAGTPLPSISPTATYDSTQAYGASHFFGLNNLFNTGTNVASATAQVGIANLIQVRPDLVANTNALSVGKLSSSVPAPTGMGLGITANDASVALAIGDALTHGTLTFNAAGELNPAQISTTEYAIRIMSVIQNDIVNSTNSYNLDQRIFEELTTLAQTKSGVDPSEEIMKIFELSTSQNLTAKALNIVQSMGKDLIDTLGR